MEKDLSLVRPIAKDSKRKRFCITHEGINTEFLNATVISVYNIESLVSPFFLYVISSV